MHILQHSKKFLALALSASLSVSAFAQKRMAKDYIGDKKIYYGAAYYPEAWDVSEMDLDIKRMKELNMNVMRIAEFAWSTMEPEEGKYNFKWLHDVIDKLKANGIDVILGTPTATPPAWMVEKYPEIMQTNDDGQVAVHGVRRDVSYTNATYRKKAADIVERMAKEFGKKPGVIGWQTDNEFGFSPDYSKESEKAWHAWLKQRYGTIENLNKKWRNALWSQTYNRFEQIPMPRKNVWHHPSLRFDWTNFNNDEIVAFQDNQVNIIRKYSNAPITHDGMPNQAVDYEKLFKDLDFMALNNYHSFEAYDRIVSNYDRMRGYNKGMYWLFETAPNNSGGGVEGQTWFLHQRDGSMRAALWMNYALGGQGAMFWLWRQQPAGQEMVHGSVISAWNKPAVNYQDIKNLGAELKKTSDFQMNAPIAPAEIAMIWSHQAKNGLVIEKYANDLEYYSAFTYRFFLPLVHAYLHRDVIAPSHDFSKYKIIFAPILPYISDEVRAKLKTWVNNGGTLVLGPMSGYRNSEWANYTDKALGDLEAWIGAEVDSRYPIGAKPVAAETPTMLEFSSELGLKEAQATLWSESISTKNGKVIAKYSSGMHKGLPAIVENKVGKGKVVLLGTDPGQDAIKAIMLKLAQEQNIKPLATGDAGVIVAPRNGQKEKGTIVVNIDRNAKSITLPAGGTDLLTGEKIGPALQLKPYEVRVISQK